MSPSGLRHGTLTPASLVQIQPPLPRRRGPLVGQRIVYPPYEGSIPFVGASFNTANAVHSGSSVGRVAVSKTVGRGFESLPLCTVFSEFQVARTSFGAVWMDRSYARRSVKMKLVGAPRPVGPRSAVHRGQPIRGKYRQPWQRQGAILLPHSSVGRAPDFDSGCPWFESKCGCH